MRAVAASSLSPAAGVDASAGALVGGAATDDALLRADAWATRALKSSVPDSAASAAASTSHFRNADLRRVVMCCSLPILVSSMLPRRPPRLASYERRRSAWTPASRVVGLGLGVGKPPDDGVVMRPPSLSTDSACENFSGSSMAGMAGGSLSKLTLRRRTELRRRRDVGDLSDRELRRRLLRRPRDFFDRVEDDDGGLHAHADT